MFHYYPWFQATTEGLGRYPPQIRGITISHYNLPMTPGLHAPLNKYNSCSYSALSLLKDNIVTCFVLFCVVFILKHCNLCSLRDLLLTTGTLS